ncbi:DUF4145 domain-containing protein [Vibrio parahaemolyticus]|uniref:DUF4145 domain-containing protein n=1 Tax=Vibrio parahaemolyticus TaxID=670 RepID=UPI0011245427|nr:DUF4145 domain-containing protein [Vibrio parahaemolyticus]ELB2184812.1 DUF4145 domain-containing protein [Vibrio parahaemolyticus]ELB2920285.1 DUF4145 domain-containing protein [Vibrio parahaemolyticus]MBE4422295.1 DUF4145 domain-containing protein [Vibrio parahaemolyticus]TOJ09837.1 hypothetical protein CGI45_24065 [Vibrio parahaemolyticus]HAS6868310.1 DUF4145 domain-containing protein [Vibrio parahaemolyticus]
MSFQGHRSVSRHDGSSEDSWEAYSCGHCGTKVSGAVIASYEWIDNFGHTQVNKWLLCPQCVRPSTKFNHYLFPGTQFGPKVQGLPEEVEASYSEARRCMEVNAFTAAELICRKILMHVAVDKGAKEGESFAKYLDYLEKSGYVTPPMKGWVDLIRQHGNKSTHKLESPEKERAQSTVMFTAELLRLVYEMEFMYKQYSS